MALSKRVVVCQQPNYFAWLGYLEQCATADTLIFLDTVQWIRQGRQHRARILPHPSAASRTGGAEFTWLTLPVRGQGHRDKPLREIEIAGPWASDHWKTLQAIYARRPFFKTQLEPLVRPWLESQGEAQSKSTSFSEVAISSTRLCLEALGFAPEIRLSSQLPERGRSTERLVSLCQAVSATAYYTGVGATYIDSSLFRDSGIELVWQRWKQPEYDQGRATRKTHLSVLDALANVPLAEIRSWLEPKPWGPFGEQTRQYLQSP